ncbi:MAG: hypothetical protein ACTHL1_01455 [Burkholderiaceae bacterium]
MHDMIYDKTAAGRDEISTRQNGLLPRLRTLLLLVDGKTNAEALLKKVAGLGLGETHLEELRQQGFIAAKPEEPAAAPDVPTPASAPAPLVGALPAAPQESEAAQRFQALYQFYNDTIRSNLGLRGLPLQLKVEKAATMEELRAIREPYLEAVAKAKGDNVAQGLRSRLDGLLSLPPMSVSDFPTNVSG